MDKHLRAFLIRLPRGVRPHLGAYEPVVQKVIQKMQEMLPVIQEQQREAGKLVDSLLARYQPPQRRTGIRRSRRLQETLRRVHAALQNHDFSRPLREMAAMLVEAAEERRLIQHSLEQTMRRLQRLRARRPC